MINVIKRNKTQVEFDKNKIIVAIEKAKNDTPDSNIKQTQIIDIADYIEFKCNKLGRAVDIEDIQDMVENGLMGIGQYQLARNYVRYRYNRELNRGQSSLDARILSLVDNQNEEVMQENSNKNPTINSTQRDYIAGEVSKDMCRRLIFSKDVMDAHDKGIIHVHDLDYALQHELNCCLCNLEDMLQNGTVISGVMIEKPKSLRTAATIMTQIMAQVASVQYGGQSMSIGHIAPFVDVSRKKIKQQVKEELKGIEISNKKINAIVESRLKREIKDAIQTIQYQILTLNSSNGQSPFVSLYLSLGDAKNEKEKKDIAMLIEEIFNQRIAGIKNEVGVPITIQFPKLLYVLDEDNINPDSEYYWLTELAAKCTAKRMVPDYISAKKCREYKEGNVISCMGAVSGDTLIYVTNTDGVITHTPCSFEKLWNDYSDNITPIVRNHNSVYIDLEQSNINLFVRDMSTESGYTKVKKIIRNTSQNRWVEIKFEDNVIYVTTDHPLPTIDGRRVFASDLKVGDKICATNDIGYSEIKSKKFIGQMNKYEFEYDFETESDRFDMDNISSHNCRSFLAPWIDEDGKYKFWGRSNLGVVTINLPYIALLSKKNKNEFWKELDKYLEVCHKAHMTRYDRLKDMVSDYAPIMWQHGGLARLKPGEKVSKYLEGGYCSISLGYAGLYECVKYMTGKSHVSDKTGKAFGIKVMEYLNNKCDEWKRKDNLGWSIYGTPIESCTYKFGKSLQRDFGKIKDVSDHNYVTNSFHTVVREEIDAFTKLSIEGEYQKYSLGGVISYVECPNMEDNIPAVLAVIKHIYENTLYAELNIKSDYCQECGWEKEIPIVEEKGKLIFKCPNCGNSNRRKLNIARRVCGYISTNEFNQGRTQEIKERVLHL